MDGAREAKRDRYTTGKLTALAVKRISKRGMHGDGMACTCSSLTAAASRGYCATRSTAGRAISASALCMPSVSRKPASAPLTRVVFCSTVTIQSLHDMPPVQLPVSPAPAP